MSRLAHAAFWIVAAGASAAEAADDLEARLSERKATLASLSTRLDAAAGASPDFDARQDIHVDLRASALQSWIDGAVGAGLTVSAIGVSREGDLANLGGVARAWLGDPPREARARLDLTRFEVVAKPGALQMRVRLQAHAEARVYHQVLGLPGHTELATRPDIDVSARLRLDLEPADASTVAYRLSLVAPTSIPATMVVRLGPLGEVPVSLPIDSLAHELGRGVITLGYNEVIRLALPTSPPQDLVVRLRALDPKVEVNALGFAAYTDVAIETPASPHSQRALSPDTAR